MTEAGYAVALLTDVVPGDGITAYLEQIDDTLSAFDGRFLIHGGTPDVREGSWAGDLVVIVFPTVRHARQWYSSDPYRHIVRWRTDNSVGTVALFEGVGPGHRAVDVLTPSDGP